LALNTLKIKPEDKFPIAIIGFCEIPPNHQTPSPKITEVNEYIKLMDSAFLEVDAKDPVGFFTRDGIHYNKPGLGRLAASMKKWARENGHSFEATSGYSKQRRSQERLFPWNQQNPQKRTKFTVEEGRSNAAINQHLADKPWQPEAVSLIMTFKNN